MYLYSRSLENEILSAPSNVRALDALQVSPYRITQVVDSDGVIHSLREVSVIYCVCSAEDLVRLILYTASTIPYQYLVITN